MSDSPILTEVRRQYTKLARLLNEIKAPMPDSKELLGDFRKEDLKNVRKEGQAEIFDISVRSLHYSNENKFGKDPSQRLDDLAETVARYEKLDGIRQSRIIPRIQEVLGGDGQTARAAAGELREPLKEIQEVLDSGLAAGYWSRKGKKYFSTGKVYQPPPPAIPQERWGLLCRTLPLVGDASSSHRWVFTADVSPAGAAKLKAALIEKDFGRDGSFLARPGAVRNREIVERGEKDPGRTDGLAMTTGFVEDGVPADRYGVVVAHHLLNYVYDRSIDIDRVVFGLDGPARSEFLETDLPDLTSGIKDALKAASRLGRRDSRKLFAVTISYANLSQ